jgi:peptide deformylase
MTVRPLALMGNPVLLARAAPVELPASSEVRALAADLIETMRAAGGIGIAAPQVHVAQRLIVVLPIEDRAAGEGVEPLVLVNPELEPLGTDEEEALEGCLSIPELRGPVPRWRRLRYRAADLDGRVVGGEAEGLFARILQHEVDHLDGILFPFRMRDLRALAFASELAHLRHAEDQAEGRA